ncbi:hypothetical protein [Legionella cincinnatiensis]|uniref:Uncharacterized protein n=1 Tax=Legionella cincinnatiensis TaxID=28085 RepID=A0A378IGD4_9GAMM|nr:hypothetical protein [Legionella cincinnatiensis]KTC93577.1 hypothetical protein Lcin_0157 [Legionella cincinnatiensis]STX34093.1 Uncharacterised protein [Legionella cincinnatiensis]
MRNFKYVVDDNFAKSEYLKNAPCYRTVICAAFLEYYTFNECEETLRLKIDELINSLKDKQEFRLLGIGNTKIYLEIYPVPMQNKCGFVVIDHTGGCFPLIIYPYPNKSFNGKPNLSRCLGLSRAIENIEQEKERIIRLFIKYKDIYDFFDDSDLTYDDFQNELHSFIYSTRDK